MQRAWQRRLLFATAAGGFILGLVLLIISPRACPAAPAKAPPQPGQAVDAKAYLGTATCTSRCHRDEFATYQRTVHRVLDLDSKAPVSERGCEACHGPAARHKEAVDLDEEDLQIKPLAKIDGEVLNRKCISCHKSRIPLARWLATEHAHQKISCRDCHRLHADPKNPQRSLLKASANEVCISCHGQQRAEFRQNSRHPLLEGRLNCTDCHDPHTSPKDYMLKREGKALCASCHQEKKGPFVFEHDPTSGGLAEECLTCHRPHGSPNPKLQTLFGRGLCLQCHSDILTNVPHQTRAGNCWRNGCHSQIHGSQASDDFLN